MIIIFEKKTYFQTIVDIYALIPWVMRIEYAPVNESCHDPEYKLLIVFAIVGLYDGCIRLSDEVARQVVVIIFDIHTYRARVGCDIGRDNRRGVPVDRNRDSRAILFEHWPLAPPFDANGAGNLFSFGCLCTLTTA